VAYFLPARDIVSLTRQTTNFHVISFSLTRKIANEEKYKVTEDFGQKLKMQPANTGKRYFRKTTPESTVSVTFAAQVYFGAT